MSVKDIFYKICVKLNLRCFVNRAPGANVTTSYNEAWTRMVKIEGFYCKYIYAIQPHQSTFGGFKPHLGHLVGTVQLMFTMLVSLKYHKIFSLAGI